MMLLVATVESSGIDRYSQELAKRTGVPTVESRRYLSLKDSLQLIHRLRQSPYPIHFAGQHFGRHGLFLGKPFIVTVHDLVRICFPFAREAVREKVGLKLDALGLKKAQHIIAVSAHTKADLVRYLKIPEDKITVVHNGVDHSTFKPAPGKRFDFPYLLYVGTERPRKNLGTLLRAFAILKKDTSAFIHFKLLKVGSAGRTDEFRRRTISEVRHLGLEGEVIFVDWVSDEDLAGYYSSATALVMPSLYEGFGLPLIEAMACGCPVIASNSSSLPEVAGDAGLLIDPHDPHGLAEAMRQVITEPALRAELIEKGFKRTQRFSWERAAQETLQVYSKVEADLALRKWRPMAGEDVSVEQVGGITPQTMTSRDRRPPVQGAEHRKGGNDSSVTR